MLEKNYRDIIKNIFVPGRKCIINTDLDGLLSGMLLNKYLGWEIAGYSSCAEKESDELWIRYKNAPLTDYVFVDLPVCMDDYTVIDQHFVAFDESFIGNYNKNQNKINPNIMMGKIFYRGSSNTGQYTEKYPFGTTHFIIAVLECLGIMKDIIPISKKIDGFDVADLILRADRVIGNTCQYTPNCLNWAEWLMKLGGENTRRLFTIAKNNYTERKVPQSLVENKLMKDFSCKSGDGECSNLFLDNQIQRIRTYFEFLSNAMDLPRNLVPDNAEYARFGRLSGTRMNMTPEVKAEVLKENVFSYAIVNMREVSITYME